MSGYYALKPIPDMRGSDLRPVLSAVAPDAALIEQPDEMYGQHLVFYRHGELIEYRRPTEAGRPNLHFVMTDNREAVLLDGTHDTLQSVNQKAGLAIDADNAEAYLLFYFQHVGGNEGKFEPVRGIEDLNFVSTPPAPALKSLEALIERPALLEHHGQSHDEYFLIQMTLLFKRALLACRIKLNNIGEIDIIERDLVIDDLPLQAAN